MTVVQVQNLCNFAASIIEESMSPTVEFEEENGETYYLCPNESLLPPMQLSQMHSKELWITGSL